MHKIAFLSLALILTITNASATPNEVIAQKAFASGNTSLLTTLYKNNQSNQLVNYYYSQALLNRNNPIAAQHFVANMPDSFMRSDMIHDLLDFYFNNKLYSNYADYFKKIPLKQTNLSEKCGYDIANHYKHPHVTQISDVEWLSHNNTPEVCASLISLNYELGTLNRNTVNQMLYNLLINDKISIFNSLMSGLKMRPQIFSQNVSKHANVYQIVYSIKSIAKRNPDAALKKLNNNSLDSLTHTFLNNYIAMQYASKQNFNQAIKLFEASGDTLPLSDDEYEWRTRSYLYSGKWQKILTSIEEMPSSLKTKNVWLYWQAKAYDSLNQPDAADIILKKIPHDYSYYSMLAQAELGENTDLEYKIPAVNNSQVDQSAIRNAQLALSIYQTGRVNRNSSLAALGQAEWNYIAKYAITNTQLAMSKLAQSLEFYDLSIYAANQLPVKYVNLSFPNPFLDKYRLYSVSFGISPSYALAVSRQESRFNHTVIAFDGGVGLMQLMPQTARFIAHKAHFANCYRETAACNIKFGTWYLGNLYTKFGNLIYSTAAYNAGPHRPLQWQNQFAHLDNKIQIELIPINITRDYVQKVLVNKAVYDSKFSNADEVNLLKYIRNISGSRNSKFVDDDNTDSDKLKN